MGKDSVWRENRLAVTGIVALIVLCVALMGYVGVASGEGTGDDSEPFVTDRVVEVRIVMSDEDWVTFQLDALEEEYVQADFWFDGELVEDVAVRPKGNSSLNSVVRQGSTRLSLKVDFNFFNSARTFRGLCATQAAARRYPSLHQLRQVRGGMPYRVARFLPDGADQARGSIQGGCAGLSQLLHC